MGLFTAASVLGGSVLGVSVLGASGFAASAAELSLGFLLAVESCAYKVCALIYMQRNMSSLDMEIKMKRNAINKGQIYTDLGDILCFAKIKDVSL